METKLTLEKPEHVLRVQAQLLGLNKELEEGKVHDVIIQPHKEARSLDANAYFWELAGKLAPKLKSTEIEIYRHYIRDYGVSDKRPIRDGEVEMFTKRWNRLGLGWFVEDLGASKLEGCTNVRAYYGSSIYNKEEMSRIIEAIVKDCKDQEIETRTPAQIADMMSLWETKGGVK